MCRIIYIRHWVEQYYEYKLFYRHYDQYIWKQVDSDSYKDLQSRRGNWIYEYYYYLQVLLDSYVS